MEGHTQTHLGYFSGQLSDHVAGEKALLCYNAPIMEYSAEEVPGTSLAHGSHRLLSQPQPLPRPKQPCHAAVIPLRHETAQGRAVRMARKPPAKALSKQLRAAMQLSSFMLNAGNQIHTTTEVSTSGAPMG